MACATVIILHRGSRCVLTCGENVIPDGLGVVQGQVRDKGEVGEDQEIAGGYVQMLGERGGGVCERKGRDGGDLRGGGRC